MQLKTININRIACRTSSSAFSVFEHFPLEDKKMLGGAVSFNSFVEIFHNTNNIIAYLHHTSLFVTITKCTVRAAISFIIQLSLVP